jgi:CRISPR-associated endonuclease/helicase Cas3
MGNQSGAKVWWRNQSHWCGEVQRQQRFRDSKQDEPYYLWLVDDYATPKWKWKNEHVYPAKFADQGTIVISDSGELNKATGNNFWFDLNPLKIYTELANDFSLYLSEVSERFGEVRLIEYGNNSYQEYKYHPNLGLYKEIGNNND